MCLKELPSDGLKLTSRFFFYTKLRSCFLTRESAGVLGLIEKLLGYAISMQKYTERLATRLQDNEQMISMKKPTARDQPSGQLTEQEREDLTSLRSSFGQHALALLTLMNRLAQVGPTTFAILTQCMNWNNFYKVSGLE